MNALSLLALFVGGLVFAVIVSKRRPKKSKRRLHPSNKLDLVDEMFLWGEVNNDDFYRM